MSNNPLDNRPSGEEVTAAVDGYFKHVKTHNPNEFIGAFSLFLHENHEHDHEKADDEQIAHVCQFIGGDMSRIAEALAETIRRISDDDPEFGNLLMARIIANMAHSDSSAIAVGPKGFGAVALEIPEGTPESEIARIVGEKVAQSQSITQKKNWLVTSKQHSIPSQVSTQTPSPQ